MLKYQDGKYFWKGPEEQVPAIKALGFTFDKEYGLWGTRRAFIAGPLLNQCADGATLSKIIAGRFSENINAEKSEATARVLEHLVFYTYSYCPKELKLLPFQNAGIEYITSKKNTLLADDMGLGKTVQAIGAINHWPNLRRILIICPASVKLQWKKELEKWSTKYFKILVVEGRRDNRVYTSPNEIVIMNYALTPDYKDYLRAVKWGLKIVDESHYLMTPSAKRTQAVLGAKAEKNIFLSGTPGEKPYELWTTLNHLDPDNFNDFWDFARRYCGPEIKYDKWVYNGAENLEELQYILRSSIMIRRTKAQVMPQLGEKIKTVLPLDLRDKLSSYNDFKAHITERFGSYDKAVEALSAGELDNDESAARVRREIGLAKVPAVVEIINNCLREKDKIVCFTWHRDVTEKIKNHYGSACVVVNGATTGKNKELNKQRFIEDPTCKIYIGQIRAMTGVDGLQEATDTCVFAEIDWSYKNMVQAEDRLQRHGQKGGAMYYYPVIDESIETFIIKKLQDKKENFDKMYDT